MKRLLFPAFLLSSSAGADAVDCSTMQLVSLNFLIYKEKAVFPDPAREVTVDLTKLKAPFKACGATFTGRSGGSIITIQTAGQRDMNYLTSHFPNSGTLNLPLYLLSKESDFADGLEVTVKLFDLSTTYDASVLLKPFMTGNTVVGVKVDGGRIQPLYWNKQYATVKFSPKAKVLDFYVKSNVPVSWQRITVDLVTPKMTIYRKAAFPSK